MFGWFFVLRGVVRRHVFGESTAITHRLNDWALLTHLSSPFWSKQHSSRGSSACLQEGGCSVCVRGHGYSAADCFWCGREPHCERAAADRRCCMILLMARQSRAIACRSHPCTGWPTPSVSVTWSATCLPSSLRASTLGSHCA